MHRRLIISSATVAIMLALDRSDSALGDGPAVSSSIMAQAVAEQSTADDRTGEATPVSMFAVAPPKPREFDLHELVQIVVRETSSAKRSQELETKKDWSMDGEINAWPDFRLSDLVNLQIYAGRTANLPELDMEFNKDFKGEGDYTRRDDIADRLTAEIIEILPNGNLVLEARTRIKTDDEESVMKVSGICRPEDITAANTVLSNQIHDLTVEKSNNGELKKAGSKGIIAKVLETVFAF